MSFDGKVEREVALARAIGRKKVGRKHNHQPRGRAAQREAIRPINRQRLRTILARKFSMKVAAYWRGELDAFPSQ